LHDANKNLENLKPQEQNLVSKRKKNRKHRAYGSFEFWLWIKSCWAELIPTANNAVSHHSMMMVVDVLMMQR
jgi:hypothetical protein